MKKIILIVTGTLVSLIVAVVLVFIISGPQKKDFVHLMKPRIIQKKDTPALLVNFDGLPDVVIKEAFGNLFKVYYSLKGVKKGPEQPAPIARFENIEEVMRLVNGGDYKSINWKGYTAIPIPQEIKKLPDKASSRLYPVNIKTLKYGTVAEIVHFGPYEKEQPVIEKLLNFIKNQGYEISGLHEEEYIKGPGMPFVNPENYITIIRYQVKKI